jgi:plastocyanin
MTATIEIPKPSCQAEETEETYPDELRPATNVVASVARRPARPSWDQFLFSQLPLAAALALIAALVVFAMVRTLPAGARWPGQSATGPSAAAPAAITTFSSEMATQHVVVAADASGALKWDRTTYEATAGDVTFVVSNPSPMTHNFLVEGPGVQAQSANIAAKETLHLTLKNLPPGEYTIACTFAGHREAGMVAKLIVK